MEQEIKHLKALLTESLATPAVEEETDETGVCYAWNCSYCGVQVWHDPSHGYAKGTKNQEHQEGCLVIRAQKALGLR